MAKDTNRELRVDKELLDNARVGNDRAFVMLAGPQIEAIIRLGFHFPASGIQPRVPDVEPREYLNQQVVPIHGTEPAHGGLVGAVGIHTVPYGQQVIEGCLSYPVRQHVQQGWRRAAGQ